MFKLLCPTLFPKPLKCNPEWGGSWMDDLECDSGALVDKLYNFCASAGLRPQFRAFAAEHAPLFAKIDTADEQPLKAMAAFRKYEMIFEADIDAFRESELGSLRLPLLSLLLL